MTRENTPNRWTQKRIYLINLATLLKWIKPGEAATILVVHRSTVDHMLRDGRLRYTHLGGSKLRSVLSADVLTAISDEIEGDRAPDGPGHCPSDTSDVVRRVIYEGHRSSRV